MEINSSVYRLEGLDVFLTGLTLACVHGLVGLFVGGTMSVMAVAGAETVPFGAGAVVVLPLMNLFMGFLGGAFLAASYNFFGRFSGGLKLVLSRQG